MSRGGSKPRNALNEELVGSSSSLARLAARVLVGSSNTGLLFGNVNYASIMGIHSSH